MKATWTTVMIYEDVPTREEAVRFSDSLVQRFWAQYEFEFHWCGVEEMGNAKQAQRSAHKAMAADLIVFALRPEGEMPESVMGWIESWVHSRGDREGVLAGLLDPAAGASGITTEKYLYLRNLAHRAGMDYLIRMPEEITRAMPNSLDSYAERAGRKTSVLDDIVRRRPTQSLPRGIQPNRIVH